jgi:hypothetical protein
LEQRNWKSLKWTERRTEHDEGKQPCRGLTEVTINTTKIQESPSSPWPLRARCSPWELGLGPYCKPCLDEFLLGRFKYSEIRDSSHETLATLSLRRASIGKLRNGTSATYLSDCEVDYQSRLKTKTRPTAVVYALADSLSEVHFTVCTVSSADSWTSLQKLFVGGRKTWFSFACSLWCLAWDDRRNITRILSGMGDLTEKMNAKVQGLLRSEEALLSLLSTPWVTA